MLHSSHCSSTGAGAEADAGRVVAADAARLKRRNAANDVRLDRGLIDSPGVTKGAGG